jgi:transposase-like protein
MERRQFTREFKLEAVRLIKQRGVSYAQASKDLGVHPTQLRNWVKELAAMESFFSSLKTERTARKCTGPGTTPRPTSSITLSASTIRSVGTRRSDI